MKSKDKPELRLSSYNETWKIQKLNEVSDKVTEKNKNNQYKETLTNSAEFGIISQRDFFEKDISNEKNLNSYYVVRPDDFVYNPRISNFAPVGPIKRNKLGRTGVMSPLYYVFRTKSIDRSYLESYFSSMKWHLFMKLNGDSGARSDRFAIKDSIFGEMPIPYPSHEEQREVGSFFKQLDDTIIFHQHELETLKQTKQGFLQKMFPKEGETVPEVRFHGFSGEWKMVELNEIVSEISTGKSNFIKHDFSDANNYPILGSTSVIGFDSNYDYEGDFILTARVGANAGTLYRHTGKVKISDNTLFIKGENLSFIYPLLNYIDLKKLSFGSGQPLIKSSELKKIKLLSPASEEQNKIGEFFSQLDKTIELHEKELEALKETKKAFLQKMFV